MPLLEILGPGCAKCKVLMERTEKAAAALGGTYTIRKVEDLAEIASRGVMSTPALAVDGVVKVQGRVPTVAALSDLIHL